MPTANYQKHRMREQSHLQWLWKIVIKNLGTNLIKGKVKVLQKEKYELFNVCILRQGLTL